MICSEALDSDGGGGQLPRLDDMPQNCLSGVLREGTGDVLPSEVEDGGKQQLF